MTLEEQMRLDQEKAFADGKNEGLIEGRAEERTENAKKMKSEGIDIPLISKIMEMTIEEIEKL